VKSAIKLPDEEPRERMIVVMEATKTKAIKAAEKFYPFVRG
jgi:hypothetical protein